MQMSLSATIDNNPNDDVIGTPTRRFLVSSENCDDSS